jgi:ABC-type dipeptide/oligopeptide/nickel transport system permease subunit
VLARGKAVPELDVRRPEGTESVSGLKRVLRYRSLVVGGALFLILILAAILAPVLTAYAPDAQNVTAVLQGPSAAHLFGTDQFGRDLFARVLYGSRYTFGASFASVLLATLLGTLIGITAGMVGGYVDLALMRVVDLILIFPGILPALAITAVLGPSLRNLVIAIGLSSIPTYARVVQAMTLQVKQLMYVESAHASGASPFRTVFRHVLPSVGPQIIVSASTGLGISVLYVAALGFLGLGVQPPAPELGTMLSDGSEYTLIAWWISFFPGLVITLYVIAVNLVGDGLRDLLDPHAVQRLLR